MIQIRAYDKRDWDGLWRIMEPVFRAGDTHPVDPAIEEPEALHYWTEIPTQVYVAVDGFGRIVGSYHLKPNQPPLGAHVCNCGYLVAEEARRQGIGTALCEHSQREARALGYRAMQYNLVVSTNHAAVALWKRQGFEIVGTLPGAFKHAQNGYVDALVMYKALVD